MARTSDTCGHVVRRLRHSALLTLALAIASLRAALGQTSATKMVICAELPRNNSFWQVEAAIVAAYQAAARDISAGDCSYVKDCERLLPASLNVTLQTIQGKKYSRRDSAYVAMACNRAGGHLSLMGSLSLPETMVPINQVNNIVTGTSILAAPSYLESGYFRTHPPAKVVAEDLAKLASLFEWEKMILLYSPGDGDFAANLKVAGEKAGVDIGMFLIASDFHTKIQSIQEIGSSIIVLSSWTDFSDGSDEDLHNALRLCSNVGLLDPKYTWLGVYRADNLHVNDLHDHEDEVLNNLLRSMLFLSSEPGNSRPDVAERLLSSLDQAQFSSLHNSIPVPVVIEDFKQIVREEHIGMFAAAYDTVWLAAAAFSRFSASGGTGCPQQADPSGLWSECLLSVSVAGASGNLSLDTDWSTTNTLHNLTFWQLDDSKSLTMIGIFSRDKSIITSVNGQAGIKWRDGSIFPPDRPRADVSAAENKAWMSGSLWVAVAVAAVLLVAFLGILFLYFQLRRTLSSISPSNLLDVESPLIKAADLLQELSRTFFLTRRLRTKALHTSLMLMGSEDVFAPDLVNQSEGVNKDILSFLTFANKTGYKGARSISYAADITVGKNKDTAVLATLPEQPHSEMTLNGSTKDLHLVSSANDEEVVNVVVPPAAAGCGTDLFFDSFANAAASGGQPILSVGMHALRHFGLIRRFHLDDEMLARFIKDIEAGYNDLPYHNAIHAADVLARFCALINSDGIMLGSSTEDKLMILAAILAAIVHDFQHPGLSNAYQIAVETDICREFNEQHVLENLSIKRALEMMRSPRYNFTYRMRTVHRRALHSNMITLVLATDMSKHFEILTAVKTKILSQITPLKVKSGKDLAPGVRRFSTQSGPTPYFGLPHAVGNRRVSVDLKSLPVSLDVTDQMDDKQKMLMLQLALKIADVGHACTTFEQHVQWSQRLQNEFFAQGDKERQDDLEISPLMNRQKPGVMDPKNQTTFDDVIVVPMLEAWSQIGPTGGQTLMNQTLMNKKAWEGIAEQRERVEESPGTV